jgi:hypothetical protein
MLSISPSLAIAIAIAIASASFHSAFGSTGIRLRSIHLLLLYRSLSLDTAR